MAENKNHVVYVTRQTHANISKRLVNLTSKQLNNCYRFTFYDLSSGFCTQESHEILAFLDNPPEIFKTSVRAVIFNSDGFKKNGIMDYKLHQQVTAKLNLHKIPFRFNSNLYISAMCQLIAAKVDPAIDQVIYQFHVYKNWITVKKIIRIPFGYIVDVIYGFKEFSNFTFDASSSFKIIISNATWVPNSDVTAQISKIRQHLNVYNPIVLEDNLSKYLFHVLKIIVGQMYNRVIDQYFILPSCSDVIRVSNQKCITKMEDVLLSTQSNQFLPLSNSCIVPRFHKTFYITSKYNFNDYVLQKPSEVTKDCHRIKLTLSVDINNYPTITHEPIILPRIQKMPKKLNIEKTEKLPVIGFSDNSSVICLWNKKENCYKFLESWNGKFGKDLFMDFLRSKPTLISSSTEVISLSGAVYDLIKIMSMPSNDIKVDRNWKFTFTKDAENPVLLEFQTAKEGRKAASPAFLMALMLKQHIKAIRKETVGKPAKIGFRLFDDFENREAKKRVEVGLKEACEMLKISCIFV